MEFQNKLSQLAYVCVKVGVNIQRSQELIISSPLEAYELVQHIARIAYQQGAKLVTCFYDDATMIYDRFLYADNDTFDYAPEWMFRRVSEALENGAARLYIVGPYPDLLGGLPTDKTIRAQKALAIASSVETKLISESRVNWSAIPYVTDSWSRKVFPDLPSEEASRRLWKIVFDVTRASDPDPCRAWEGHNRALNSRRDFLQRKKLVYLHFYDGQTDLEVGLADGHQWVGGTVVAANSVECNCNIPTEEIFTCPHRERTNGKVFFSKPLALAGALVENLCVEFRDGLVESVTADKGKEIFENLLATDDGARRLGEIGLVPNSSPISHSNILFYNALFDENGASHVAFGQSYRPSLVAEPQSSTSPEEAGANQSSVHIDCTFGNSAMSVDGITESGLVEPIMRDGEFVI